MTALTATGATSRLVSAHLLKLRRRRGLTAIIAVLTVGLVIGSYVLLELLHLTSPARHHAPGGTSNLGAATFLIGMFASVGAAIVGATAGVGDLDAGVYRDLVTTGRSRVELFLSRIPAGLVYLLPFVAVAYALAAIAAVVLSYGEHPAPSTELLALAGLWTLLETAFYFLLALALACLIGSRAYAIAILLAWRLALTPLLSQVTALGVTRELIPGVALQSLAPARITSSVTQGPPIDASLGASVLVLVGWATLMLVAAGRRDITRDT